MRKVTTLLLALFITAMAGMGAKAQQVADLAKVPASELKAPSAGNAAKATGTMQGAVAQAKFTLVDGAAKATAVTAKRTKARAKVQSINDLEGKYVMSFKSLTTSLGDGGSSVTIKKLSADSIEIQNFWTATVNVRAKVNADMSIEIPNQKLYDHTTYGPIDLAVITTAGKPDRTQAIKAQVNEDGTISISSWWAAFVVEGSNKDNFLVAAYNAALEKSNATMGVTFYSDSTSTADDPQTWNVIVTQKGKNLVSVKNLGNHGQTLDVVLKSDSTFTIAPQITWTSGTTMGDFYLYMVTDAWAKGNYTSPITGKGTETELSWGPWVMLSTNKYYTGKLNSAVIKIDGFKFEYPQAASENFTGAGTEADPYQIKTLEDLVALSEKVNNDPDRSYAGPVIFHTKTFLGKYFKLMNDIDMTGYRFEPIGNKWNQRFAGTFDGGGHTLKGLDINTGSNGYAALFGMADTAAVIKNINVTNANVVGASYYAGIIGGYIVGKIENCHTTGTVQNDGITAAGIVGLGTDVKDCTFSGTIIANGGYGGGIAGQVYGEINNCHAAATIRVGAPADTYTGGGIVGMLYGFNSACRNSYFTGTVDGTLHSNLYIGGVVGHAYRGTVESCFAQADVYGYDNESSTGGIVGQITGGVLSDGYFNGYVQSGSSRMTGGITGCVRYSTNNDGSIERQSTIKNCYFAGRIKAESYLYDPKTEIRETLGKLYNENTVPTIENIYYDKQMVPTFGSVQYGALTSELTSASGPKGFSADKWTFTEGYYPRIKGLDDNDVAKLSASVLTLDSDFPDNTSYITVSPTINLLGTTKVAMLVNGGYLSNKGHCGSIVGNTYKLNETFGNDTIVIYSADNSIRPRFYTVKAAPKFFEGNGTADKPFLIKTKADLIKLGDLTTNVEQYFAGSYFLQTNDIDMENDTTFVGICNSLTNQSKCRFAGTYDGGGHAIHNMVLTYVSWTVPPTETSMGTPNSKGPKSSIYKGFVGSLENTGVIKNLTIAADCRIDTWGYAGTFVGYNYGTVENCKNYSDFYSYSTTAGGIVGYNNPGALVKGCYNEGTVYCGYATAGGIVGVNAGTVEECLNVGDVVVKQISNFVSAENKLRFAAGIAGSSMGGVFRNCVNAGHCYAMGGMVAGLAGSFNSTIVHDGKNDVYTSINYGTLFSNNKKYISTIGNLGANGYNKEGKIEGFYYDAQLTGQLAAANSICPGAVGATTKQLTSGEALDGFSTDIWLFSAGQYPTLKRFADEPKALAAAKAVITIADGETVKGLKSNATLSADGAKWQLASGNKFAIEGNTLKVPSVTEFTYDTLTVSLNGFTRPIELAALKPVPLEGDGTEADPYQIKTTADWNSFAQYIAESQNQFEGKYVKVMNDIDFSGVTLIPMGYDAITSFGATMLGNNKTISGINFTGTATYQGVFLNMNAASSIHDLTLKGKATSAKGYVGGFAGRTSGSFYNCHNQMRVEATAAGSAGFAAQVEGDVKFVNCTNDTSVVNTKGVVGGFVANTTGTSSTKFINCQNNGNITNNGSGKNVAGFVAQGYNIEMRNCVNTGEINASKCTAVAGFVGYIQGADTLKLISCHNDGEVLGASSGAGLVGSPNTSYTAVHTPYYIDSCYNTANIETLTKATYSTAGLVALITPNTVIKNSYNTGNILSTQAVYTGGLWGADFDPTSTDDAIYVNNCYNTGDVAGVNYAGGIAGSVPAYTYITDCYNTGAISANLGGGGIAGGIMGNGVELLRCWNSGQVTTTANGAGGINGYGSYNGTITDCFNTGNVACGTQAAGGLGGQSRVTYRNCYNTGTVSGPTQVGGLVGQTGTATSYGTSFYNCYNAGKVVPAEELCGNLVGTTAAKQWGANNVLENCYYVTSYGTFEQDTIGGTGMTIAALAKATNLAGTWIYGNDYELPVIPAFADNDNAKANSAVPVIDDNDTFNNVTKSFHIGCPAGVEWSTSNPIIKISGDWASITGASTDEVQLTSTCGQFSHVWTLKLNTTSGVADNVADNVAVVGERYYTVGGIEVAKPANHDGQVYVVVRKYSDGTAKAEKILDR